MFSYRSSPVPRRQAISMIGGGTLLCALQPFPAAALARNIGVVRDMQGTGELGAATPFAPMQTGMDVRLGDRAATQTDGRAHLSVGQATQLHLGPQTVLVIDAFVAGAGGVIFLDGGLVFDRPAGADPGALAVLTDFGRIGVRGTRFFVGPEAGHNGLAIFVERGEVAVLAAGAEVTLTAGLGTLIPDAGHAPRPASSWAEDRVRAAFASILGK